jgi:hypothetical protein
MGKCNTEERRLKMAGRKGRGSKKRARQRAKRRAKGGTRPSLFDIKIKTLPSALSTFEGILAAFNAGKLKREKFTALIYGLNAYAGFFRMKTDYEIKTKLEAVEHKINEMWEERRKQDG